MHQLHGINEKEKSFSSRRDIKWKFKPNDGSHASSRQQLLSANLQRTSSRTSYHVTGSLMVIESYVSTIPPPTHSSLNLICIFMQEPRRLRSATRSRARSLSLTRFGSLLCSLQQLTASLCRVDSYQM